MEFDEKPRGAGSVGALLQDAATSRVFGQFGDECLRCYNIDIRGKRTIVSARVLRQVQSFIKDYGERDALRIIDVMFNGFYNGRHKGKPLGTAIFSQSFRWLANRYLMEAPPIQDEEEANTDDRNAAEAITRGAFS